MKKIATIYSLLMLLTVVFVPYKMPIPKVGGSLDAGYHLTCWRHKIKSNVEIKKYEWGCKKPLIQAQDS